MSLFKHNKKEGFSGEDIWKSPGNQMKSYQVIPIEERCQQAESLACGGCKNQRQ